MTAIPLLSTVYGTTDRKQLGRKWSGLLYYCIIIITSTACVQTCASQTRGSTHVERWVRRGKQLVGRRWWWKRRQTRRSYSTALQSRRRSQDLLPSHQWRTLRTRACCCHGVRARRTARRRCLLIPWSISATIPERLVRACCQLDVGLCVFFVCFLSCRLYGHVITCACCLSSRDKEDMSAGYWQPHSSYSSYYYYYCYYYWDCWALKIYW